MALLLPAGRRPRQDLRVGARAGFALLALLFFVLVSMFALSGVVTVWTTAARRDREAELLFVGKPYRQEIDARNRGNRLLPAPARSGRRSDIVAGAGAGPH